MKGVIVHCLAKLVTEKYGLEKWQNILKLSNLNEKFTILVIEDIDDAKTMELITNTTKVLNITVSQATDAFGEYWMTSYAPNMYKSYFKKFTTARDFIKGMDEIHEMTTQSIPNAHPPRFEIQDIDDKTILVTYKSSRNLIDFYIGLAKGVGSYFKTSVKAKKLSEQQVELVFD